MRYLLCVLVLVFVSCIGEARAAAFDVRTELERVCPGKLKTIEALACGDYARDTWYGEKLRDTMRVTESFIRQNPELFEASIRKLCETLNIFIKEEDLFVSLPPPRPAGLGFALQAPRDRIYQPYRTYLGRGRR